ncbi:hypothetical protein KEM60_00018 [Austwickia sp. TVS 96-490-7B]|uniref:hypothetical protein n=1 Tax=Austwickia sp. TVS 96-490-7B TaxID=2830843 RepID=UPI001C59F549|nr:hypothetical protein [Austwickia sp. TVS 96-490-7B]MBW3083840.1 hypothetical protein [Austwickia sp. TVS 96-490-7B]
MYPILSTDVAPLTVSPRAADLLRGIGTVQMLSDADRLVLAESGYLTEDGRFTDVGLDIQEDLQDAAVLLLCAGDGLVSHRARIHAGRQELLYVEQGADPQECHLYRLPVEAVPILVAQWGRWPVDENHQERTWGPFDHHDVMARCTDPHRPLPDGLAPDAARLWNSRWRMWSVQCDARDISLIYTDIEDHGIYLVRREEDMVRLVERPSSLLWGDVLNLLGPLMYDPEPSW